MVGVSIAFNAVTGGAHCTAIWVALAAVIGVCCGSIRTLSRIAWLAWIGMFSIMTASEFELYPLKHLPNKDSVTIVTIAVGLQDRPAAAPQEGIFQSDYQIFSNPTTPSAFMAVSALIFAFSGTPAFFNIQAEMRAPTQYNRSLLTCQSVVTATYIIIGSVVYYFCGSLVASPALGSAGLMVKKVAYGFALPGLLVTTMLMIHIPAKYVFVRLLRGTKHMNSNTTTHWATWIGCTFTVTLIAYIIASAVPSFDGLVSLIGALVGTLMSFQPYGCMWLYDNWHRPREQRDWRWYGMVCWSVFVITAGCVMMVGGTYGSVVGIIGSFRAGGSVAPWSCADNSGSR